MSNIDNTALYKISYGLYALTTNDGARDNAMILNTAVQVTDTPLQLAVCINNNNYSCETVKKTKKMNLNCLDTRASFDVFKKFGFASGKDTDKLAGESFTRSENGLAVINECSNAFISLTVESSLDLGTHTLFICRVSEAEVLGNEPSMTYEYYHKNVKPKPAAKPAEKKRYVCRICGYTYEGDELPADFICPWCGHGVADFEEA